MATAAQTARSPIERERAFFFYMAIAMAVTVVGGFSLDLALGRSSFGMPLIYHVHAFVFFGWVALFLLQNGLVASGSVALHQRLGWLALLWIPLMVGMGTALTLYSVRTSGGPPFFDENEFLFGNPIGILTFAGIALGGIVMRGRSDWHRRLMCCAMASITGPAFGRILPMPFLIPWSWWLASVTFPAVFPLIGIIANKRRTGAAHPAWFLGLAAMIGSQLVADALAYSPVGYATLRAVTAGTPGADRKEIRAHFPGPPPHP